MNMIEEWLIGEVTTTEMFARYYGKINIING